MRGLEWLQRAGLAVLLSWVVLLSVGWASVSSCCHCDCACTSEVCAPHSDADSDHDLVCDCSNDCEGCTPQIRSWQVDDYTIAAKISLPEPLLRMGLFLSELNLSLSEFSCFWKPTWARMPAPPPNWGRQLLSNICILRI